MGAPASPTPQLARWDTFLAALRERLTAADTQRPSVRYWRAPQLIRLIRDVRTQHRAELKTNFPAGKEILRRLEKIGWIRPIEVEWIKGGEGRFYRLELDPQDQLHVDPFELLQGYAPDGIICYFGALNYHELTTQIPPFYHVARLRKGVPLFVPPSPALADKKLSPASPLGTELFSFGGIHYYLTTRYPQYIPGVQLRLVSGRNALRITDLEQTLLDTLMHPLPCGGLTVILEAWERAADRLDRSRLLAHLHVIGQPALWRRTAALLESLEIGVDHGLAAQADQALIAAPTADPLPLLPGFPFSGSSGRWHVGIPF